MVLLFGGKEHAHGLDPALISHKALPCGTAMSGEAQVNVLLEMHKAPLLLFQSQSLIPSPEGLSSRAPNRWHMRKAESKGSSCPCCWSHCMPDAVSVGYGRTTNREVSAAPLSGSKLPTQQYNPNPSGQQKRTNAPDSNRFMSILLAGLSSCGATHG